MDQQIEKIGAASEVRPICGKACFVFSLMHVVLRAFVVFFAVVDVSSSKSSSEIGLIFYKSASYSLYVVLFVIAALMAASYIRFEKLKWVGISALITGLDILFGIIIYFSLAFGVLLLLGWLGIT